MKAAWLILLALAACGRQGELMPAVPAGQTAVPLAVPPSKLLVRPTQAEPARVDDPLTKSEERRDDRFNLPPPG